MIEQTVVFLSYLRRAVAPKSSSFIAYLLLAMTAGLLTPFSILLQSHLLNVGSGVLEQMPLLVGGYAAMVYGEACIQHAVRLVRSTLLPSAECELQLLGMQLGGVLNYSVYQQPETQDALHRLQTSLTENSERLVRFLPAILQPLIELGAIFVFSACAGSLWSFPLALLCTLPAFHFNRLRGEYARRTWREDTPALRLSSYLQGILLNRENAKERRFFRFIPRLIPRWRNAFGLHQRHKLSMYLKSSLATGIAMLFSMFSIVIFALLHLPLLQQGRISLGFYIALLLAVTNKMNMAINALVREINTWPDLQQTLTDLDSLAALSPEPVLKGIDVTEFRSISFQSVCFRYPDQEQDLLHDLSFHLQAGERCALVGLNGAGKSTLIMLLCGIYQPTSGYILLNDLSLTSYTPQSLHRIFACLWQSFARYKDTLECNVALAALTQSERNDAAVTDALAQVGTDLDSLKVSFADILSPEFPGGKDLSGGGWQKVALARALYRGSPFIILDEPTAALDPLAEVAFYRECERLLQGKTCLFISHRLGSTYLMNRILVLAKGHIIEEGDHQRLMERNGVYARLFSTQQRWYQSEEAI